LFGTRFFYARRNSSSTTTPAADSARSPRSWRSVTGHRSLTRTDTSRSAGCTLW